MFSKIVKHDYNMFYVLIWIKDLNNVSNSPCVSIMCHHLQLELLSLYIIVPVITAWILVISTFIVCKVSAKMIFTSAVKLHCDRCINLFGQWWCWLAIPTIKKIIIIIIHYLLNLGWILTTKTISQIFIKNTKNLNQWDVVTEFQLPHALK